LRRTFPPVNSIASTNTLRRAAAPVFVRGAVTPKTGVLLDEGTLLVMPTTFPGIAIEEARRVLTAQDRIIMRFREVASVHGKVGRAETAAPTSIQRNAISAAGSRMRRRWSQRSSRLPLAIAFSGPDSTSSWQRWRRGSAT
jgi:Cu/Ag efflux pump CusA